MEALFDQIDQLINQKQLCWKRNGNCIFIESDRSERKQRIHLKQKHNTYVMSSVVAKVTDVIDTRKGGRKDLLLRIWRRNALKPIITLRIDKRDRVIGTVSCPVESTYKDEIEFYLMTLARDCYQFEYILSGLDTF